MQLTRIMTVTGACWAAIANNNTIRLSGMIHDLVAIGWSKLEWYTIAAMALLAILSASLFWRIFRIKRGRREKEIQIHALRSNIEGLEGDVAKLSTENEWLVAEMHHRVKNNLQVLSSLISSQLSFIEDKAGRDILLHSKHRLYALSLVHQKLFQNAAASAIEMSCCIKEVMDYLAEEFGCDERIKFDLDLTSIKVDADTAIPFALIVNELVTNSLKYAFPDGRKGKIMVYLSSVNDKSYRLSFADDGVGLPEGFDFLSARSLGKTLIMGLSKQIRGQVSVNNEAGFGIVIDFKIKNELQKHFAVC